MKSCWLKFEPACRRFVRGSKLRECFFLAVASAKLVPADDFMRRLAYSCRAGRALHTFRQLHTRVLGAKQSRLFGGESREENTLLRLDLVQREAAVRYQGSEQRPCLAAGAGRSF